MTRSGGRPAPGRCEQGRARLAGNGSITFRGPRGDQGTARGATPRSFKLHLGPDPVQIGTADCH